MAAAGTGGHVFPALAVADELVLRGWDHSDIVFFGGDRMEASVVPEAGYPFVAVDIHGIRRSLSLDNLRLPGKVWKARNLIAGEIRHESLEVMIVFGGYIAGPAALAASATSIPLVVHEANAVPGVANRLIARRADTVYAAFRPTAEKLRTTAVIGSPLRRSLCTFDRTRLRPNARRRYGLAEDGFVVGIVGGSLGAAFLNDVATELAKRQPSFSVLHVTGEAHRDSGAPSNVHRGWVTIAFEHDMANLYAAVDLIVARGGALTMSEVQATRTPAIVVPLPAGRSYQAANAADLVASGGGIVVAQSTPGEVASEVMALADDEHRIQSMASAVPAIDHAQATSLLADRVEALSDA